MAILGFVKPYFGDTRIPLVVPSDRDAKGAVPIRGQELKNAFGKVMLPELFSLQASGLSRWVVRFFQTYQKVFGLELVKKIERKRSGPAAQYAVRKRAANGGHERGEQKTRRQDKES